MPRTVLLIDDDLQFYGNLSQTLSPYGFEVHQATLEEQSLGLAESLGAELVVIAVDLPDKVGFALCHQAKKVLTTPIVLKTHTIPREGFEKHKRLKSHANGYWDQRELVTSQLLQRVDSLIGLGDAVPNLDDSIEEIDNIEELAIEVEDIDTSDFQGDRTVVAAQSASISLEDETDAAFAAMGFAEEASAARFDNSDIDLDQSSNGIPTSIESEHSEAMAPAVEVMPEPPQIVMESAHREMEEAGSDLEDISVEVDDAPAEDPETELTMAQSPSLDVSEGSEFVLGEQPNRAKAILSQNDIPTKAPVMSAIPSLRPSSNPVVAASQEVTAPVLAEQLVDIPSETDEDQAQKDALQSEVTRLRGLLAKSTVAPGGGFSREHEFLSLREKVNQKGKALLDAQDQLTVKDRVILELREQLRTLSRSQSEQDYANLELEQNLLKLREQQSVADATLAAREQGLRESHEATVREIQATHQQEQEAINKTLREVESALAAKTEAAKEVEALRVTLAESAQSHNQALAQAAKESQTALKQQAEQHAVAIEELKSQHASSQEQVEAGHREALKLAETRRVEELKAATKKAKETRVALEEENRELRAVAEKSQAELERQLGDSQLQVAGLESSLNEARQSLSELESELRTKQSQFVELTVQLEESKQEHSESADKVKEDGIRMAKAKNALSIALTLLENDGPGMG